MRLIIHLSNAESEALQTLAMQSFRDSRSQAALIIQQYLKRRRLLIGDQNKRSMLLMESQRK